MRHWKAALRNPWVLGRCRLDRHSTRGTLQWAYLQIERHGLSAVPAPGGKGVEVTVPEHIADPSDRQPGEELGAAQGSDPCELPQRVLISSLPCRQVIHTMFDSVFWNLEPNQ